MTKQEKINIINSRVCKTTFISTDNNIGGEYKEFVQRYFVSKFKNSDDVSPLCYLYNNISLVITGIQIVVKRESCMIGDVLDYIDKIDKEERIDMGYGYIDLIEGRKKKREPIEEQSNETINLVYNIIDCSKKQTTR